jgi:hypothetical protein
VAADDGRLLPSDLLSQDAENPDRMRPGKDSPLATQGAGALYDLPAYIGALPPEGTAPWDWDRTWRVRMKNTEDKKR